VEKVRRNGVRGVSPEVLVLSEKSRYYRVMCSENKLKSQDKMGIEVFARKCLSFLKNPDILPRDAFGNHTAFVMRTTIFCA
jgi:hypothetical protein